MTQATTTPSVRTAPATATQSVVRTQATTTQNYVTTQASTNLSLSHLPIWTCYSCYDCKESTGKLVNCSGEDAVKTCYHVTYPSGRILRSCGHAGVDIEIAQVGCRETHSGLTWCRCRERGCNKYPNMTEQVQETKSNASTVLSGEADQNGQEDEMVEISLQRNISFGMNISTSNASTLPFNMSNSSNFESELEMFNFTSESAKNSINNFTATDILINNTNNSSSFTSSTLHVTTTEVLHDFRLSESTTRRTQETVTADDMDAEVTSTAAQVEEGESFFCYSCTECGRSAGNLIDCSLFHESRHCTLVRKPNGQVSRSCGQGSDQFHLPGCNTTFGWKMCVCFEDGCNEYPDIIDDRTTFPPTMMEVESTIRGSFFFCRLCFDCGEGTGISFPCSGVSSCSLTITQNRIVRDCGSTETDLMVPEEDACVTLDNFDVMCKCSTENCNIYPELTASG
ncbi:uncharacterized protein [Watersipora subatra]|uniref:uncharacterized protein n=1 Tax=Watersipora subatra TaxID=2589382 RepID=UPI00355B61F3